VVIQDANPSEGQLARILLLRGLIERVVEGSAEGWSRLEIMHRKVEEIAKLRNSTDL
jgi:hypothetical protein